MKLELPVIDLHCDLLSYLAEAPHPNPFDKEDIGCNLPALKAGNVKLQVMAVYTATEKGSTELGRKQINLFKEMPANYSDWITNYQAEQLLENSTSPKTQVLVAIENASGFCEEDEPLEAGFARLEEFISKSRQVLYIGLTHHGENRFAGGNATKVGLKPDGKILLDYLNDKHIAIDFSHASDALADDLLNYISMKNLRIPVLASHSNFRAVFNHARNLPDDVAKEIVKRKGIIGINFLRAFLNDKKEDAIFDQINYGIDLVGENALCFGADYFYTAHHPDQSRRPFFYPAQADAACYPAIIEKLSEQISPAALKNIAFQNALNFILRSLKQA